MSERGIIGGSPPSLKRALTAVSVGGVVLMYLAVAAVLFVLPLLIYYLFPEQAYRVTEVVMFMAVGVGLLALLFGIIPSARVLCGVVLLGCSYAMMPFLWVWSILIVGHLWGMGVLYFLNLFVAVGAVVGALAASLFTGHWSILGQLFIVALAIYVFRVASAMFTEGAT